MQHNIPPSGTNSNCLHCHAHRYIRCRGLCFTCYNNADIRGRYPIATKYGRRGVPDGHRAAKPAKPTNALPGTLAKIEAMAARADRGLSLWHPDDAKYSKE